MGELWPLSKWQRPPPTRKVFERGRPAAKGCSRNASKFQVSDVSLPSAPIRVAWLLFVFQKAQASHAIGLPGVQPNDYSALLAEPCCPTGACGHDEFQFMPVAIDPRFPTIIPDCLVNMTTTRLQILQVPDCAKEVWIRAKSLHNVDLHVTEGADCLTGSNRRSQEIGTMFRPCSSQPCSGDPDFNYAFNASSGNREFCVDTGTNAWYYSGDMQEGDPLRNNVVWEEAHTLDSGEVMVYLDGINSQISDGDRFPATFLVYSAGGAQNCPTHASGCMPCSEFEGCPEHHYPVCNGGCKRDILCVPTTTTTTSSPTSTTLLATTISATTIARTISSTSPSDRDHSDVHRQLLQATSAASNTTTTCGCCAHCQFGAETSPCDDYLMAIAVLIAYGVVATAALCWSLSRRRCRPCVRPTGKKSIRVVRDVGCLTRDSMGRLDAGTFTDKQAPGCLWWEPPPVQDAECMTDVQGLLWGLYPAQPPQPPEPPPLPPPSDPPPDHAADPTLEVPEIVASFFTPKSRVLVERASYTTMILGAWWAVHSQQKRLRNYLGAKTDREKKRFMRQLWEAWQWYAAKSKWEAVRSKAMTAKLIGWVMRDILGAAHTCMLSWHHIIILQRIAGKDQAEELRKEIQKLRDQLRKLEEQAEDKRRLVECMMAQWFKGKQKGIKAMALHAWALFAAGQAESDRRRERMKMQLLRWLEGNRKGLLRACFSGLQQARRARNAKNQVERQLERWMLSNNEGCMKSMCDAWRTYVQQVKALEQIRGAVRAGVMKAFIGELKGIAHYCLLTWKSIARELRIERLLQEQMAAWMEQVGERMKKNLRQFLAGDEAGLKIAMFNNWRRFTDENKLRNRIRKMGLSKLLASEAGLKSIIVEQWRRWMDKAAKKAAYQDALDRFLKGEERGAVHSVFNHWRIYVVNLEKPKAAKGVGIQCALLVEPAQPAAEERPIKTCHACQCHPCHCRHCKCCNCQSRIQFKATRFVTEEKATTTAFVAAASAPWHSGISVVVPGTPRHPGVAEGNKRTCRR
eukprot:gb/GFBE01070953.1/.p1 GENE.gb/GFBE01070953.1/~~gb/GFBE01070953.1/.p1  ORF type:complete len:1027 (+),score=136.97 gb/GFBE01070953.1/:1-3081(+)